ncbi:MAG: hypothetical protein EBY17_29150 [Acidobacteriia bacterium]|nr:hypothetical protein [Terriglobia bacterium]
MIIRVAVIGTGAERDPVRVDLPNYGELTADPVTGRAFVDVPNLDVPDGVAAFVRANPVTDLVSPLPGEFPPSLARQWAEHLARRYDLGTAKWHPVVA